MTRSLMVGMRMPEPAFEVGRNELLAVLDQVREGGLTHVSLGDHVSFHDGSGYDGLIRATSLLSLDPDLQVLTAVYLLPLRHPTLVARQLASISQLAPGRLSFGIGVGGDDPHEVQACGVDPRTRGRRTDESLQIIRRLLAGGEVTFEGEFFQLENTAIRPTPNPPIPILVGGRSDAALRRTGRYGDGWLGTWVSPRRFTEALQQVEQYAAAADRVVDEWDHGMMFWSGFGDTKEEARGYVADGMEGLYKLPFDKFEKWIPYGTPEEVADYIYPFTELGCRVVTLIPRAKSPVAAALGVAEVRRHLAERGAEILVR
jgi:alkanesulfonate monooxygenase SsuD/methylene tetrahydromethanopterin reductase-like flavin-dependent oxidoreductase (luciferase family)